MSACKEMKKIRRVVVAAAGILLAAATAVFASGNAMLMEQKILDDSVVLYIKAPMVEDAEARIGMEEARPATVTGSDEIPIVTWLLLDNSASISYADHAKIATLLTNIIGEGRANESYNLCTFAENLNILEGETNSYTQLKTQIDNLEYRNQSSYLTDAVDSILSLEGARETDVYARIFLISDGVDENPGGITREELNAHLTANNIPIYTLGCRSGMNDQRLKELFALSRQTGALNWTLDDKLDSLDVAKTLSTSEAPLRVAVEIPPNLRDGTTRGIQVTLGASVVKTQAVMPFGDYVAPSPTPAPTPQPTPQQTIPPTPEPEPQALTFGEWLGEHTALVVIVVALLVLAIAGTVVFFVMKKKKEAQKIRPVAGAQGTPNKANHGSGASTTERKSSSAPKTQILSPTGTSPANAPTNLLFSQDLRRTLILEDMKQPEKFFEYPLRDVVTIGRAEDNQIVLDYDGCISGSHCEIFMQGAQVKVQDLHSLNGTYVDDIQVADVANISNGSILRLGGREYRVSIR